MKTNTTKKVFLNVEGHKIINRFFKDASFTILDIEGQIWFKLQEITEYFGIDRSLNVSGRLYEGELLKLVDKSKRGNQVSKIISEGGLFHLIFTLNPAKARGISEKERERRNEQIKEFVNWVTNDVLPSIRQNDGYIDGQERLSEEDREALITQISRLSEDVEKATTVGKKIRAALYEEEDRVFALQDELRSLKEDNKLLAGKLQEITEFMMNEAAVQHYAEQVRNLKEAETMAEKIRKEEEKIEKERKRIDMEIDKANRSINMNISNCVIYMGQKISKEDALNMDIS